MIRRELFRVIHRKLFGVKRKELTCPCVSRRELFGVIRTELTCPCVIRIELFGVIRKELTCPCDTQRTVRCDT